MHGGEKFIDKQAKQGFTGVHTSVKQRREACRNMVLCQWQSPGPTPERVLRKQTADITPRFGKQWIGQIAKWRSGLGQWSLPKGIVQKFAL
ncbi:hypothetical protein DBR42_27665 [Pelomonas sp. HMWF004]|nr:hypothetical protein DBR42_27665 [Pelomonas sp. HMWF004]